MNVDGRVMAGRGEVEAVNGPGRLRQVGRVLVAPLVAASFLTVLPVPVPRSLAAGSMGWAVACFPLAGGALAASLALLGQLLGFWLPSSVVAALLLAALLGATGALHLDALMDSFDGLFGGRDPAGRLAIMRDSRVGSYGTAAAASLLLLEYGCLASLPAAALAPSLVAALALSRWAMAATLWGFLAASDRGMAAGLKPEVRWPHAAAATALAAILAVLSFGWVGMALGLVAGALVLLAGRFVVGKLGGITGDGCGGVGQLVEATMLVLCVALVGSNDQ